MITNTGARGGSESLKVHRRERSNERKSIAKAMLFLYFMYFYDDEPRQGHSPWHTRTRENRSMVTNTGARGGSESLRCTEREKVIDFYAGSLIGVFSFNSKAPLPLCIFENEDRFGLDEMSSMITEKERILY